ncbi:MAG: hypothetical protein PHI71_11650 [Acidiphilium sp.]|nr:hypothetical protein [Acidiphilium sp.]
MRTVFRAMVGATLALICSATIPAYAGWNAQVTGPDVFGRTKVFASSFGDANDGIVIQCNSKNRLLLGYLVAATESEINMVSKSSSSIPATLYFKIDDNPVLKFDATFGGWNNHFLAFQINKRSPEVVKLFDEIGSAQSQISVGAELNGDRQSSSISVEGSTEAMHKVTEYCKLANKTGNQ